MFAQWWYIALMRETRRKIAVITPQSFVGTRELFHGIHRYAHGAGDWHVLAGALQRGMGTWARAMKFDGAIAVCWKPSRVVTGVVRAGVRTVLASEPEPTITHLPAIRTDERAVGRLAAEYLMGQGHYNFAYFVEDLRGGWRSERLAGFREALARARRDCTVCQFAEIEQGRGRGAAFEREVASMFRALPKPLGAFGANDWNAWDVARYAAAAGLHVPEDIAIVGVDDLPLCELSDPPLSSIALPYEAIGYRAAALLDRVLQGHVADHTLVLIPPTGVTVRMSSDITVMTDRDVLAAVRFMRANAPRADMDVGDVVRAVAISRRALEQRFRQHFGESPANHLRRIRLELAKRLLLDTDLSVGQVATRSGFSNASVFCATFRKVEDTTPLGYRRRHGG